MKTEPFSVLVEGIGKDQIRSDRVVDFSSCEFASYLISSQQTAF
jgi:hypothetical protein